MVEKRFYTVNEVAVFINVSVPTVYAWCYSGELESVKFGRSRRIPVEALERFITKSKAS